MTEFPPSLSRVRGPRKSTDLLTGQRERQKRLAATEAALNALPLQPQAQLQVRGFSSLFEQTYLAVNRQSEDDTATTRRVEEELKKFITGLDKIAAQIQSMHRDTLMAWARAGGAADATYESAALFMLLRQASEWSELSLAAIKRAKRIGGRGRTEDVMAKEMRATAEFAYERLTDRKANITYDAYAGQERATPFSALLQQIFDAYGVKASAKSRAEATAYGQEMRRFF